jgi:hypothetical protein
VVAVGVGRGENEKSGKEERSNVVLETEVAGEDGALEPLLDDMPSLRSASDGVSQNSTAGVREITAELGIGDGWAAMSFW